MKGMSCLLWAMVVSGVHGAEFCALRVKWSNVEAANIDASGPGAAASVNNNYFGLTFSNASDSLSWSGSIACPPGSYVGRPARGGHACFNATNGFYVSGMAALTDQQGRYGLAALGAVGAGAGDDFAAIGAAIASAGYNSNGAAKYGAGISARANRMRKLYKCAGIGL